MRRLVTFDDKTQSFTLTDGEGKKKYFYFHVKVPFDYGKESITKLYIKSF
ncbi:hypothetical protein KKH82_08160 [Patescibacteria group bacterium]|nr:hypothetical protein [Patescibacteria group bacterium]